MDTLLRLGEAAKRLRLDPTVLRRLVDDGDVPALQLPRVGGGSIYRFSSTVIESRVAEAGGKAGDNGNGNGKR